MKTILKITVFLFLFCSTVSAQEKLNNSFNYPIHAIGGNLSLDLLFSPKIEVQDGNNSIAPQVGQTLLFNERLKYTYYIKKGWGITGEISFGNYSWEIQHNLNDFVDKDTIWSNGVKGGGLAKGLIVSNLYVGLSVKASYFAAVHQNVSLQTEIGLKWTPITFKSINQEDVTFTINDYNTSTKIPYMNFHSQIKNYFIPDVDFAFNVLIHGKNPSHNFVFGLNANVSLANRILMKYSTTDVLSQHLQSVGNIHFRTTSVGVHIGYQYFFMKNNT